MLKSLMLIAIVAITSLNTIPKSKGQESPFIQAGNLRYPKDYKPRALKVKAYREKNLVIKLFAEKFAQGKVLYVEIFPARSQKVSSFKNVYLYHNRGWVPVNRRKWGFRAMLGFSNYRKPGYQILYITYKYKNRKFSKKIKIYVAKTKYPVKRWNVPLKKISRVGGKPNYKLRGRIRKQSAKKARVFKTNSRDFLNQFRAHPRDMHKVTSTFWSKRIIKRYKVRKRKKIYLKKPRISRHHGLDLKGWTGSNIYALLRGKVVIAEKMHYEGGFVVLDHGNKIFSGYMHQSKILVKEGDIVEAGQLIGKTGATGAVTGPHLHVFLRLRGNYVYPLSVLQLPLRE